MRYYTPGTPAQRWQAFQEEGPVRSSHSNKIPEATVKEIKRLLSTINPDTGVLYGIREIASLMKVGRNTVSKINLKMRRNHTNQ